MTGFGRAQPGGSKQPVFSARYQNTIIDTINARGWMDDVDRDLADRFDRQTAVLKVYNGSTSEVAHGGILGVGEVRYDYDANPAGFISPTPCFSGTAPSREQHSSRFVVLLNHCVNGQIVPCVASGWVPSIVQVNDPDAIRSRVVDGEFNLETDANGNVPTIVGQAGTGLLWCMVNVPNTLETAVPIPGVASDEEGTKSEWVAAELAIKDGCIHVWPLITPEIYNEETAYISGDKIQRYTVDDCLEWVIHEANGSTTGTFDASKWVAKTAQRYIDKTSTPQKWWHGMAEAPEEGHYCVGVKGELVYYDCFKIPGYV